MMENAFYNEAAEKNVLAHFATKRGCADLIPSVMSEDFYVKAHRSIFGAMQTMYAERKPIDMVTVADALVARYGEKNGHILADRLADCLAQKTSVATEHITRYYIEILKAAALRRKLLEIVDTAKDELLDETNEAVVVLDATRKRLSDVIVTKHAWESMSDVLLETFDTLEKRAKGEEPSMPSGIALLDRLTTGFHRGELTLLGARPAVGKSALGAAIALATAEKGYKVGIVSREMTAPQYGTRILAGGTKVENSKLRTGDLNPDDWEQISKAMSEYAPLNVSFMFSARYIEDLRMEVQKKVDAGELDMLVVDYVQLLQTKQKFQDDYMRIAYVSKALKDMTIDFNIAILGLAQVGRSAKGTMPTLSELRGSGDLEQDADNVIFLHRPEEADDKFVDPKDRDVFVELQKHGIRYMVISIAKQRQGQTGDVTVAFEPARMRFLPIHAEG